MAQKPLFVKTYNIDFWPILRYNKDIPNHKNIDINIKKNCSGHLIRPMARQATEEQSFAPATLPTRGKEEDGEMNKNLEVNIGKWTVLHLFTGLLIDVPITSRDKKAIADAMIAQRMPGPIPVFIGAPMMSPQLLTNLNPEKSFPSWIIGDEIAFMIAEDKLTIIPTGESDLWEWAIMKAADDFLSHRSGKLTASQLRYLVRAAIGVEQEEGDIPLPTEVTKKAKTVTLKEVEECLSDLLDGEGEGQKWASAEMQNLWKAFPEGVWPLDAAGILKAAAFGVSVSSGGVLADLFPKIWKSYNEDLGLHVWASYPNPPSEEAVAAATTLAAHNWAHFIETE